MSEDVPPYGGTHIIDEVRRPRGVTRLQTRGGNAGYRDQLARAARFFQRIDHPSGDNATFQDDMWAFFQNCWHVKDWVRSDPRLSRAQKDAICDLAHQCKELMMCKNLCNGAKHLRPKPGATHRCVDITIAPDEPIKMDSIIDDGSGNLLSGVELAHICLHEWMRIFAAQGLPTDL